MRFFKRIPEQALTYYCALEMVAWGSGFSSGVLHGMPLEVAGIVLAGEAYGAAGRSRTFSGAFALGVTVP